MSAHKQRLEKRRLDKFVQEMADGMEGLGLDQKVLAAPASNQ